MHYELDSLKVGACTGAVARGNTSRSHASSQEDVAVSTALRHNNQRTPEHPHTHTLGILPDAQIVIPGLLRKLFIVGHVQ